MQTKDEVLIKQDFRCTLCNWGGHRSVVNVHHIHPKSDGGSDMTDNQIVLCPNHHALVSAAINKDITEAELRNIGISTEEIENIITLAKATTVFSLINNIRTYTENTIDTAIGDLYNEMCEEIVAMKQRILDGNNQ